MLLLHPKMILTQQKQERCALLRGRAGACVLVDVSHPMQCLEHMYLVHGLGLSGSLHEHHSHA